MTPTSDAATMYQYVDRTQCEMLMTNCVGAGSSPDPKSLNIVLEHRDDLDEQDRDDADRDDDDDADRVEHRALDLARSA